MAKKKDSTPRRKKYNKAQRLRDAKAKWLPTVTAKNIVRSYSKWYGVDLLCAINELEILGYKSSDNYKKQVELSIASKADAKEGARKRKKSKMVLFMVPTIHFLSLQDIQKVGRHSGLHGKKNEIA